jgi:hypothetical protein
MLPPPHHQQYRQLRSDLVTLQSVLSAQKGGPILQQQADRLWQQFQIGLNSESSGLESSSLEPSLENRQRSLQTEIHKHLRLLTSDFCFLAAARQAEKVAQRTGQIGDRIGLLIQYCDALLSSF